VRFFSDKLFQIGENGFQQICFGAKNLGFEDIVIGPFAYGGVGGQCPAPGGKFFELPLFVF